MPHFSADLLDALLEGDPAEREALRALLGGGPAGGTGGPPAPLPRVVLPRAAFPRAALAAPPDQVSPTRPAVAARATKRRPGPVPSAQGRMVPRLPIPGRGAGSPPALADLEK